MKFAALLVVALSAVVSAAGQTRPVAIEVAPEGRPARNTGANRDRLVRGVPIERVASSSREARSFEERAFELVNAERRLRGLKPLRWSSDLSALARQHSQNMAAGNFFSHRGEDGSLVDDRAERLGVDTWAAIGENIAFIRGYEKPADLAVDKWMQSPSHRNNLLSPRWHEAAIGVAVGDNGTLYFTQVFILRN
jgi:uncharacterized protein YkwD